MGAFQHKNGDLYALSFGVPEPPDTAVAPRRGTATGGGPRAGDPGTAWGWLGAVAGLGAAAAAHLTIPIYGALLRSRAG